MSQNLYAFSEQASFEVLSEPESTVLMVDKINGNLLVTTGDGDKSAFPLIPDDGTSQSLGVFLKNSEGQISIGEVEFLREPLLLEYFPLNESSICLNLKVIEGGGHIGIIDIRDVGRSRNIKYHLHLMPVSLAIEGNYLVISTPKRLESDKDPNWYELDA